MEKYSVIILITILQSVIFVASEQPAYVPTDNITLNCGATTDLLANDGRSWAADKTSKFGPFKSSHNKSQAYEANTQDGSETVPYMTVRVSRSEFKNTFPVTPGQKFVLLYFHAESYKEYDRSKAFFPVKAGSFTLLKNFSASLVANSKGRNWFPREFYLNVEDNEVLDLVFTPSRSASNDTYAFINGIEIVSMPTNLYYTPPDSGYVRFIGHSYPFPVENDTALEMAYRLNVEGKSISPNDDPGLFRLWSDDSLYMTKNSYVTVNTSMPINYTMIQRYTAPKMVYRTARTMGPSLAYNEKQYLSWRLPVGSGFKYMVRLHFCEPQDLINSPGDWTFKVFINNQTAEENADVIMWTGHARVSIFKDYVVFVSKKYITIDLHPIHHQYYDVILNGIEVFKLSNSDGNLGEPNPELRVAPPPPSDSFNSAGAKTKKRSLLIACVGCAAGLITIISLLVCMVVQQQRKGTSWLCWWVNQNEGKSTRTSLLPDELCRHFSLDEIKAATNNFHDDLVVGKCGFGKVFKGFIDEGEKIVAIKRLNLESSQGIGEFLIEIKMLFQLRHVHLVSLIRYCNEKQEMILLYDFMSNGTLSDHLYGTSFAYDPLTWKQRLEICKGTATGLNYLHIEMSYTVIHRDVKTSNILLDDKFTAKVSDFGLSKEDPKDEMLITGIKGTRGHMDPKYARGHKLTEKSDVYAFGVVLFEVLCARKVVNTKLLESQMSLAHWAKQCIADETLYKVIDPYLIGKIAPECFKVFVEIAESCITDVGTDRPSMNGVMERFGIAIELQMAADAEMSKMDLASECSYLDIVFPVARDMDFNDESKVDSDKPNNEKITIPTLNKLVCNKTYILNSNHKSSNHISYSSTTFIFPLF
ncbi:hypothetical protein E1A91_A07G206000v1 [Gossypium mustelinum]|uniref:Protein kinase domain-containing protein n=1 Tax=Gossypium mustelinum TaxID=34275 RepID=A0A5D2YP19_GOSMU|nr:hypothetical protein E1A91_A07G206000v1 [Gossypium mustelinum]